MKKGFTLAETLITLAIVGVVAAILLPNFITDHRNKVYVTQLQKAWSSLENGFKQSMARSEADSLLDTMSNVPANNFSCFDPNNPMCTDTINQEAYFKKVFNVVKTEKHKEHKEKITYETLDKRVPNLANDHGVWYYLADGSSFVVTITGTTAPPSYFPMSIFIDTNGDKGPNIIGLDLFWFYVDNQGSVVPYGSDKFLEIRNGNIGYIPISCDRKEYNSGYSCATKIQENGWKITY